MSTDTAPAQSPAPTPVRDRADVRRQIKLVTIFALLSAIIAWWTISMQDHTVHYLFTARDRTHLPKPVNGFAIYLITLAVTVLALLAAALNKYPRNWLGSVGFILVGVAFFAAFRVWFVADFDGVGIEPWITNPLPSTFKYAPPLILGALAGVLCERAGVVNIAIEAQLLMGAFFGSVVSSLAYSAGTGLIGAILAGVLIAWLLGVFALRYQVDQVVVGVVLIVLATGLTKFLLGQIPNSAANPELNTLLTDPVLLKAIKIPVLSDIPLIGPALFNQTLMVYFALVAPLLVWFLLYRTRWGLRVRSVGEHPKAADTVGINVNRVRWQAVLLGGAFAGLGGAFFTIGSSGSFDNNASGGQGFMALAAVIMGRWHPIGASLAALFFSFMFALKFDLGSVGKIDSAWLAAAPFLATLIAVAGFVGRVRAPAADGEPYVKA